MRTLAWLKNHCMELDGKGLGYMHPHISAVEVLAIIGQLDGTVVTGGSESIAVADGDLPILAKVGDINPLPNQE